MEYGMEWTGNPPDGQMDFPDELVVDVCTQDVHVNAEAVVN